MNNFNKKYYYRPKLFIVFAVIILFQSCKNKPKETIKENEFYVCSMDPQIMEKQMGMCPICKMPLTKTVIDKTQLNLVKLSDEQINLGNIKVDTLRYDNIWNEKTLTGVFTINQNLQQQISSRFNGRIENLNFKIPGQEIKKGDVLYQIYSRELMRAEEEYLFAINESHTLSSDVNGLIESAKNRLLLWGLTEEQVKILEEQKEVKIINTIYSKVSGTAVEILVKEGDYINEGSVIFNLADLTSLWVEAQVYTNELELIGKGAKLVVIPEAFPEEEINGEIEFSNPELQPQTKINLIRIKITNKRKKFIPGMMALVIIKTKPVLTLGLPIDAVIRSGKKTFAWVQNLDGSFEPRLVTTGIETKTKIEILKGLSKGEVVVSSGAYLIYSDFVFKKGIYPLSKDSSSSSKDKMQSMPGMNM